MIARDLIFHHIGFACQSISSQHALFYLLGFKNEGEIFEDPRQKIRGLFLVKNLFRIELLEPLSDESPLNSILKRGLQMYHQAYESDNFEVCVQNLLASGAVMISPPTPAVAFNMRPVTFLMLKNKMIVEVISSKQNV